MFDISFLNDKIIDEIKEKSLSLSSDISDDIVVNHVINMFFTYVAPFAIRSKFPSNKDGKDLIYSSKINGRKFSIYAPAYANLNTAFVINDLIKKNSYTNILNCGTGWGETVAIASIALRGNPDANIISLENFPIFTDIAHFLLNLLNLNGFEIDNFKLKNVDLIPIEKHKMGEKYKKFFHSEWFKLANYSKHRKGESTNLSYDITFDKKFDLIIIDGPSFFRLPTFLTFMDALAPGGAILFDGCRKEIPFLKYLKNTTGVDMPLEESGKPMNKRVRIRHKYYTVHETTVLYPNDKIRKVFLNPDLLR